MKNQIANIITSCRIICSLFLLFCPVFSFSFYVLYLFCGITDMVDGAIARKTKSVSEFGTKLDSVTDIVFAAVCFAKILPLIHFPVWLWILIASIAIIKIQNIVFGIIYFKQLVSIHSFLNKATGLLLFLLPLTLKFFEPIYFLAMSAAINEAYQIRTDRKNI